MSMLPTHPRTGLVAVGWRNPRPHHGETEPQPIWPIAGGAVDPPADPPKDPPKNDPPADPPKDPARDPENTDWKAEAKKWEARAKQFPDLATARRENDEMKQRLDKLGPLEKLAEALGAGDGTGSGPTDTEKLAAEFAQHKEELAKERDARWRAEVALDKGLTEKQAARLVGKTKEELVTDADEMLKDFPVEKTDGKRPLVVSRSGTGSGNASAGSVSAGRDMYKPRAKTQQQ